MPAQTVEPFSETPSGKPAVRGALHRPADPTGAALVLAHGAGSDHGAPLLVAVGCALAGLGVTVLRCDLPYRQARPAGPPSPAGAARDRDGLRSAVQAIRRLAPGPVFLGGHSYGGRQASILVAEDVEVASGLLLLSYPIHPPHRPEQRRTAHFSGIRVPVLFVHGTRDPFGSIVELRSAAALIRAPTDVLVVEGGAHSLLAGARSGGSAIAERTAWTFAQLMGWRRGHPPVP
jgi:hypothetical protein